MTIQKTGKTLKELQRLCDPILLWISNSEVMRKQVSKEGLICLKLRGELRKALDLPTVQRAHLMKCYALESTVV